MKKLIIIASALATTMFVGCNKASSFLEYRKESQKQACLTNMNQIRSAAEMCRLSGKKPTRENLFGLDGYIKVELTCPLGGTYKITADDKRVKVACPHADEGHVLPEE